VWDEMKTHGVEMKATGVGCAQPETEPRRPLGLAVLQRARESNRVSRVSDANSKFFHRKIKARRKKKPHPKVEVWLGSFEEKSMVQDHFRNLMSRPPL
jgi:hypothetical protein